jgi:hypothetical protein
MHGKTTIKITINFIIRIRCGFDKLVGMFRARATGSAIRYGLDSPGFESQHAQEVFSAPEPSRLALESFKLLLSGYWHFLPKGKAVWM